MSRPWSYFRICSIVIVITVAAFLLGRGGTAARTSGERKDYLKRARIWEETEIPRVDFYAGPKSPIAVLPEEEVSCWYSEGKSGDFGATPKFKCTLYDTGEVVRIKFSRRETFAELAANRLFWGLGFYADENYPVRLRCMDCPEKNPAAPGKEERRMERIIDDAVMERNFPGVLIERYEDQGVNWKEIELLEARRGGATRAELDALKLLAVFVQHTDSKPSQQRLACYEEDLKRTNGSWTCRKPILMIQDLGATFGMSSSDVNATSSAYLKGWRETKVWNHQKEADHFSRTGKQSCFGNLTAAMKSGLFHPAISEEGRAFLAQLLSQLSDNQITDIFRVARVERTGEKIDGRDVTIEDWVAAFKEKRQEIVSRRCPAE